MPLFHARPNSFNLEKKGFTPLFLTTKQRYEAGRAGFTLIEVVVAALIVAILAAGTASVYWGSQHFLNRARHRMQAYNFAVEALDRLRSNYEYGDPEMTGNHNASDINCSISGEMAAFAPLPADFTYVATEPEPGGYKQVSVAVHWNEPR